MEGDGDPRHMRGIGADALHALLERGIVLEDSSKGTRWRVDAEAATVDQEDLGE